VSLRVFENRARSRIFGHMKEKVTGNWRKLLNEELRNLYSSPHNIKVMKSKNMKWAGNERRVGKCEKLKNL